LSGDFIISFYNETPRSCQGGKIRLSEEALKMKKLIILLCLLIVPSICQAEILDDFKTMRYRLEAGTTFATYKIEYQNLYIAYRKTESTKYKDLIGLYSGLQDVWNEEAQGYNGTTEYYKFYNKFKPYRCNIPNSTIMGEILCTAIKAATELEKQ
jgi:hypothetical protein